MKKLVIKIKDKSLDCFSKKAMEAYIDESGFVCGIFETLKLWKLRNCEKTSKVSRNCDPGKKNLI